MSNQSTTNTTPATGRAYPPGYGLVEPVANYRPWDVDPGFQEIFARVRDYTMVDVYRLWILWVLARRAGGCAREAWPGGPGIVGPGPQNPGRPNHGAILEVGSWRGGSGAVLARATQGAADERDDERAAESDPPRVYLADTFSGVVKAGTRDTYYKGGEHANTSPALVRRFLDGLDLGWVTLLAGMFPEETGSGVENERFSLCHIDVDVYQSARDVFDWVWPRMTPGGVVVFDDYGFHGCEGVTACVGEIMAEFPATPVIPNLSGQAIVVRVEG